MKLINKTNQDYKKRLYKDLVDGDLFIWVDNNNNNETNDIWIKTEEGGTTISGQLGIFEKDNRVILLTDCELHYKLEKEKYI